MPLADMSERTWQHGRHSRLLPSRQPRRDAASLSTRANLYRTIKVWQSIRSVCRREEVCSRPRQEECEALSRYRSVFRCFGVESCDVVSRSRHGDAPRAGCGYQFLVCRSIQLASFVRFLPAVCSRRSISPFHPAFRGRAVLTNIDRYGIGFAPSPARSTTTAYITTTMAALHRHHIELLRLKQALADLDDPQRGPDPMRELLPKLRESEKQLVRESWASLLPTADRAAELFFQHLFELQPTLRPLFKTDLKEQGRRLIDMLDVCVNSLDCLDQILPAIQALGRRHGNYGVRVEHYVLVRETWLWMLEQVLADRFTHETRVAWSKVYQFLTDVMQLAAASSPLTTSD